MHLHLESPGGTLWAVAAGAVLATVGGFIATQLEAYVRRRERERSAALLFGEILSALETITAVAQQARSHGEPYGPLTLRLIRAAQRETETYSANRTLLYDLRNAEIRIRYLGKDRFEVTDATGRHATAAGQPVVVVDRGHARHEIVLRAFRTATASPVNSGR